MVNGMNTRLNKWVKLTGTTLHSVPAAYTRRYTSEESSKIE